METVFFYLLNLIYIIEGYIKLIYDKISGRESKRTKMRYLTCIKCEHNKKGICKLCGCIIKAKVRVDFMLDNEGISLDGCPERKW